MISKYISQVASFVWGPPLMVLLLGTGLYLSFKLLFIQFRGFSHGVRVLFGRYDDQSDPGEISHFKALATALSATIGTGNIVGVAAAILIGGPGAVFWMWMTAFVGMATKFTSCTLAVHFRKIDENGETHGGPMYFIEQGLGKNFKWLAVMFAFFTMVASFGIGNMFQANSIVAAVNGLVNGQDITAVLSLRLICGVVISILTAAVLIGGIKRIAAFAAFLVPFMCVLYVFGGLIILIKNHTLILPGIYTIFFSAFHAPESIAGGLFGGVVRAGVARGLFSNEAGLGSAAMAHGAARTSEPVREGLVAMLGPFIDTIIVCSITGLVIVCTGAYETNFIKGQLTAAAFELGFSGSGWIVSIGTILFAFSTIIAWSYYGDRAVSYLFGKQFVGLYRILYVICVVLGAVYSLDDVINFCDIMNALMALPNLIALILLSSTVKKLLINYFKRDKCESLANQ